MPPKSHRVAFSCWLLRRGDCKDQSKTGTLLSFYQVKNPQWAVENVPEPPGCEEWAPPYVLAPKRLVLGSAIAVVKFKAIIECRVRDLSDMPNRSQYAWPKRMYSYTARIMGLKSQEVPCKGIERSMKRAVAYKKGDDSIYRRVAGTNNAYTNGTDEGTHGSSRGRSEEIDEEDDDEGEDCENHEDPISAMFTDEVHALHRYREHPASLLSPMAAPMCYRLSERLELAGCSHGTQLPLEMRTVDDMANPRESPAWCVAEITQMTIASHADITNANNTATDPENGRPIRYITTLTATMLMASLATHQAGAEIASHLMRFSGLRGASDVLSIDEHVLAICRAAASNDTFRQKAKRTAARSAAMEILLASRFLARSDRFHELANMLPENILEMFGERQLSALTDSISRRGVNLRLLTPTELAAAYSHVVYFRPLLLQRLAYAACDFYHASEFAECKLNAVMAQRRFANNAWYANGTTVSTPESRGGDDELSDILFGCESELAVFDGGRYALPSSCMYCGGITDILSGKPSSEVELVSYRNSTACVQYLAQQLRLPASQRQLEALRRASRTTPVLIATHSYAAAEQAKKLLGGVANMGVAVMCYTVLASMGSLHKRCASARRMSALLVLRADMLGDSELYSLLESFRVADSDRAPIALFHNHCVGRPRRFFGTGSPLYALHDAGAIDAVVDWTPYTMEAALANCEVPSNEKAAFILRAMHALDPPSALHQRLTSSRIFTCSSERIGKFVKDNGRDVQFFTIGHDRSHAVGERSLMGHSTEHPIAKRAIATWCHLYANASGLQTNREHEVSAGQRIYLADIGQLAYVREVGLESTNSSAPMVSRDPGADKLPISVQSPTARLRLEAAADNSVHTERHSVAGYGCCELDQGVIIPLRHHVIDGTCIPAELYAGPSVRAAVIFCRSAGLTHRSLSGIIALVDGPLLLVPLGTRSSHIAKLICRRPTGGFMPANAMRAILDANKPASMENDLDTSWLYE